MKQDSIKKKTTKKPAEKKTGTSTKISKKSVDKDTKKTNVNKIKKPIKKQETKKPISKAKAKVSKKSINKPTKKASVKITKKPVAKKTGTNDKASKKIADKTTKITKANKTKKPISKTKAKTTKKVVKQVSEKTVKKTNGVDNTVDELIEKRQEAYDQTHLDVLSSLFAEKESKEKKLKITIIICIVISILLMGCVFVLFDNKKPQNNSIDRDDKEVIIDSFIDSKYKDIWNEYHDNSYVPDDYIGQIIFESGIINEPVMQGETNDTYLNRNYKTYKYEVCGPVFMDFACKKDDQNIVLYGHTRSKAVDPNRVMMFTPLHLLEDKNNYEANKTIYFVYEDYVDVYLVSSVYSLQTIIGEDGLQYLKEGEPLYYLNSYSDSEFKEYMKVVKQRQLYGTDVEITTEDKLLTLQTCLEGSTDKFIVLAKKIETRQYK